MAQTHDSETPVRILLGGGIGSGKSLAGRRLARRGATVVESDRLGHAVLEPDGEAFEAVRRRWPSVVVDGRIDRPALAAIVFGDPESLQELESLTHPAIVERIAAGAAGHDAVVIEVPLMLDVPGRWVRVFIDAPEALRIRRAVERGATEADVRRRIANQADRDEWIAWADRVIVNDAGVADLERKVDALWDAMHDDEREPAT